MMTNTHDSNTERRSWWKLIKSCSGTELDRRNQYRFIAWLMAWAVSFLAATWALRADLGLSSPVSWLVAVAPNVFGIVALFAYLRFLRMADELLRKIQLEGLALGFGAGVVFAMGYQLLERAGAPQLQVTAPAVVMMFGWALGQLLGMRRYR